MLKAPVMLLPIGFGSEEKTWWVKFSLDIHHLLAWHVVQVLGHVLKYLSLTERLPKVFKPLSPPRCMNGGCSEFLSWVFECQDKDLRLGTVAEWPEGILPSPVEHLDQGIQMMPKFISKLLVANFILAQVSCANVASGIYRGSDLHLLGDIIIHLRPDGSYKYHLRSNPRRGDCTIYGVWAITSTNPTSITTEVVDLIPSNLDNHCQNQPKSEHWTIQDKTLVRSVNEEQQAIFYRMEEIVIST